MKKFSNNMKALMIQIAVLIIALIWYGVASITYNEVHEMWLGTAVTAVYVLAGVFFLNVEQKAFLSIGKFSVCFLAVSTLLSVAGGAAMLLAFINPAGLMIVAVCIYKTEIPYFIGFVLGGFIPPILLYVGLKIRISFDNIVKKNPESGRKNKSGYIGPCRFGSVANNFYINSDKDKLACWNKNK